MDSIVVRTFHFPTTYVLPKLDEWAGLWSPSSLLWCIVPCVVYPLPHRNIDQLLKMTEVMGEGRYSFSIPMQIL